MNLEVENRDSCTELSWLDFGLISANSTDVYERGRVGLTRATYDKLAHSNCV